jgi:SecD/SecF fusion protein
MQGKGFVKLFSLLLLFVVGYQVLLTFGTWGVESTADNYANDNTNGKTYKNEDERIADLEKFRQQYLDSVSSENVFLGFSYQTLKRQQLALGLDLKGGMSVVLQVDLQDLIIALSGESNDPDFRNALAEARKNQKAAQSDFVTLFGQAYEKNASGKKLAAIFTLSNKMQGVNMESTNAQVLAAIRTEASATVGRTYKLLKERIDKFGVAQPVVSLDATTDRINVELPGVTNPARARQYLQTTANLEFWDVYRNNDQIGSTQLLALIDQVNTNLKIKEKLLENPSDSGKTVVKIDTLKDASGNPLKDSLGNVQVKIDSTSGGAAIAAADSLNPGPIFKLLSPQAQQASAQVGYALAKDTVRINELLASSEAQKTLPRNARFVWSKDFTQGDNGRFHTLYCLDTKGKKEAPLQGERITNARSNSDARGTGYAVELDMDNIGAQEWKKMTERNVGREVAIVLDNKVYSAPVVQGVIAGGNTQISGNFTTTEAADLANILSIGKLPSRAEIIEEAIVGPSLGAATVKAGLISLIVGFVSVMAFMLGYYSFAGFISVLALLFNLIVIVSCLASFGTVLTLPGIAGIVLTIGMAVDANVIIFERMREELRKKSSWYDALQQGFAQSYSSIFDANITTLLTAIILFYFGLGPIKGFAIVLIVGVISSVFTAVFVGRLLFDYFSNNGEKELSVGTPATMQILSNPTIDFMAKRKMAYGISGAFILAGIVSIFVRGFELGVDLQGGRSYTVQFAQAAETDAVKEKIVAAFGGYDKVVVKQFNSTDQVKITTSYLQDSDEANPDQAVLQKVYEGVKAYAGKDFSFDQFSQPGLTNDVKLTASSKVGPTIADDIQASAYITALFALIAIFGYIFIRFRKWQYSAGAIIALAHDVLVTVGVFSIFRGILPISLEVNQEFIAAILTVIGYSINDTVIVFDRIRETVREKAKEGSTLSVLINDAINNTLSRTFMTSFTTLLVVVLLFLFGGDSVRGFSFALLVGIGVGTYSSIFIASPLIVDFSKSIDDIVEPEDAPTVKVEKYVEPEEEGFTETTEVPNPSSPENELPKA